MYCTQQNLIDRFGIDELIQLTDRTDLGVIDATVLAQAISDACAEIDGYLTNYTLPLVNVPVNLVRIACDLTRSNLYMGQTIEPVKTRRDNAVAYLVLVGKGIVGLGVDSNGVVEPVSSNLVQFVSIPNVFSRNY